MTEQHTSTADHDEETGEHPDAVAPAGDSVATEAPSGAPTDAPADAPTEVRAAAVGAGPSGPGETGETEEVEGARAPGGRRSILEREGEVAADFLETLLDIADLDGDIDIDIDGDRAAVSILDSDEGRVPRRLVGADGKVLEALQELTRLAVQADTGERSRLMLDVAGHRAERRAALVEVARRAVGEARASGEEVSLDPMTAFERKVVHDEVLAAGLTSESSGTEPRRHVVVIPS